MPSIEPYITPRDFRALPDAYLALYIALNEYAGWAYGAVHGEHCADDFKPSLIAAAAAASQAAWYVHTLPHYPTAHSELAAALTAIAAAPRTSISEDVTDAVTAVRALLGEPVVPTAA